MASASWQNYKYIYDLPYFARKDLCRLLDQMEMWEELAGKYMGFDMMMIQDLRREERRGESPTDELLTLWGHKNHTILELFVLLSKMQHYQAMLILKDFVNPSYHRLIEYGEERLPLLSELKSESGTGASGGEAAGAGMLRSDMKDMEVGSHNFNNSETNNLLQSKDKFAPNQQPEIKILNTAGVPAATENKENLNPRCNGAVSPVVRDNTLRLPPENREVNQQSKISNASDVSSLAENCSGAVPHIDFQELAIATSNWSKKNILGKGGFGTVYKGAWKNTQVAVKRIEQRVPESAEKYQEQLKLSLRELRVLNLFRHDNILPLYGYSFNAEERCFVYQFMCNGSLEDRLLCRKGTEPLSWHQRHDIAKGTARGLQFLHNSTKPFIHGDIKSANILLDVNFIPRIGDFGLAREGPQDNHTHMKVSKVFGTRPYLPDEFLRGKQMSTKVDTYSFGIVLFELGTGLRAYDDSRHYKLLKEHVENCELENLELMIDSKVPKDLQIFYHLMVLGKTCVIKQHRNRPEMEMVLKELEQPPQWYSPGGPNSLPLAYTIPNPVYSPPQRQMSNTPVMLPSNTPVMLPSNTPVMLPSNTPVMQPSNTPLLQPSSATNRIPGIPSLSHSPPFPMVLQQFDGAGAGQQVMYNEFLPIAVQEHRDILLQNARPSTSCGATALATGDMDRAGSSRNGMTHSDIVNVLPALSILGISPHQSKSVDVGSKSKSLDGGSREISTAQSKSLDL